MKQSLGIVVLLGWFLGVPGAKVRSWEALLGEALQQSMGRNGDQKSFRLSEKEIEYPAALTSSP